MPSALTWQPDPPDAPGLWLYWLDASLYGLTVAHADPAGGVCTDTGRPYTPGPGWMWLGPLPCPPASPT